MPDTRPLTVMQLLPALEAGGVERSTLEINAALMRAGHRSIVVSASGRLIDALKAEGGEHIELDIGRKSPWTLRHAITLKRLIERLRPDIVHVRSRLPAWLAVFALKRVRGARPHFVTTVHGLNSPGRYSAVMTRGERVICVSNTVRIWVRHHYPEVSPERLIVIPRGIDPDEFPRGYRPAPAWREQVENAFPALRGRRWLLLPGRGTRLKGHAAAIALLAALRCEGHEIALMLLGADQPGRSDYLHELHRQAQAAGVADAVAICPPRADVRDWIAESALVLQLSERPESFGRTVVEAAAIGTPVLGWDHGGVGELLHALYSAGAVPLGDAAALTAGARGLLAAAVPPAVPHEYTLRRMQDATLALYRSLVDD